MATAIYPVTSPAVFPYDAETRNIFSANFDQRPFQFRHALDTMEIFQMPALLNLAERCMRSASIRAITKPASLW